MRKGSTGGNMKTDTHSNSVEVISKENFHKRLEKMSSCENCQKERSKKNYNRKHKRRKRQIKSNTPIVVSLKETLKLALRQRHRSVDDDMQTSDARLDDTSDSSERSSVTEAETYRDYRKSKKRNSKNLSALLTVIQKAHEKEPKHLEYNLASPVMQPKLSRTGSMLNNMNNTHKYYGSRRQRKNIVECDNIDVICNDLRNNSKETESPCDSDVENTSESSSSEIHSEFEIPTLYDLLNFQYPTEHLDKLAELATGYPLFKYNISKSDCPVCCVGSVYIPQCMPYWGYGFYPYFGAVERTETFHSKSKPLKRVQSTESTETDLSDTESATSLSITDCESDSTENIVSKTDKSKKQVHNIRKNPKRQLWDIGVAKKDDSQDIPDGVFVDLTDMDVTITVEYHQNLSEINQHYAEYSYITHPSISYSCLPGYSSSPYNFMPSYSPYADSMPKTALIPPHEMKKFTATQPPQRQWIILSNPDRSRPSAIFTVMCYNVLCDKYCTRQQYGYCPSWALNWDYRKKSIIDEIKGCSADIISLQEVETEQFYNFFLPELKREGYDGIFSPKSRARTMTDQEKKHVDGCAIFYRTTKFTLVKEHLIEFNQLAMANAEGSDDMVNRVMTKDNIGLAALLETKERAYENGPIPDGNARQIVMVATAHIHWDPEYSDVKLIQTMMLMNELQSIIEETCRSFRPSSCPVDCNAIPLILCGDLNSLPDSGVLEYLISGKVAANHLDFKERGYETCLQKLNPSNDKDIMTHSFRLSKAYENDILNFTNYTFDFKGTIDYIFHSTDHMKLLGVLGPLETEWFIENKVMGCPHPHVPSDHFPLFVEFEMPVTYTNGRTSSSSSAGGASIKFR